MGEGGPLSENKRGTDRGRGNERESHRKREPQKESELENKENINVQRRERGWTV